MLAGPGVWASKLQEKKSPGNGLRQRSNAAYSAPLPAHNEIDWAASIVKQVVCGERTSCENSSNCSRNLEQELRGAKIFSVEVFYVHTVIRLAFPAATLLGPDPGSGLARLEYTSMVLGSGTMAKPRVAPTEHGCSDRHGRYRLHKQRTPAAVTGDTTRSSAPARASKRTPRPQRCRSELLRRLLDRYPGGECRRHHQPASTPVLQMWDLSVLATSSFLLSCPGSIQSSFPKL